MFNTFCKYKNPHIYKKSLVQIKVIWKLDKLKILVQNFFKLFEMDAFSDIFFKEEIDQTMYLNSCLAICKTCQFITL